MSRNSFFLTSGWLSLPPLVISYVLSDNAFAQSTAALQGTVTDPSGAVVPGAEDRHP